MSKFLDRTIERAKQDKKTIVLAEGGDIRTIRAAAMVLAQEIANIIIIGDADKINEMAKGENLDISAATIICPEKADDLLEKFLAE